MAAPPPCSRSSDVRGAARAAASCHYAQHGSVGVTASMHVHVGMADTVEKPYAGTVLVRKLQVSAVGIARVGVTLGADTVFVSSWNAGAVGDVAPRVVAFHAGEVHVRKWTVGTVVAVVTCSVGTVLVKNQNDGTVDAEVTLYAGIVRGREMEACAVAAVVIHYAGAVLEIVGTVGAVMTLYAGSAPALLHPLQRIAGDVVRCHPCTPLAMEHGDIAVETIKHCFRGVGLGGCSGGAGWDGRHTVAHTLIPHAFVLAFQFAETRRTGHCGRRRHFVHQRPRWRTQMKREVTPQKYRVLRAHVRSCGAPCHARWGMSPAPVDTHSILNRLFV